MTMLQERITLKNRLGLHARAAARFVNLANQFESDVRIERVDNGKDVDGRSILGILLLAAGCGVELLIKVDGEDEGKALMALCSLIESRFGEEADVF